MKTITNTISTNHAALRTHMIARVLHCQNTLSWKEIFLVKTFYTKMATTDIDEIQNILTQNIKKNHHVHL